MSTDAAEAMREIIESKVQIESGNGVYSLRCISSSGVREAVAQIAALAPVSAEAMREALENIAGFGDVDLSGEWPGQLRDIIRSMTDCAKRTIRALPLSAPAPAGEVERLFEDAVRRMTMKLQEYGVHFDHDTDIVETFDDWVEGFEQDCKARADALQSELAAVKARLARATAELITCERFLREHHRSNANWHNDQPTFRRVEAIRAFLSENANNSE